MASYNVENLFDDREDGREYAEYRGQSPEMYQQKLAAVARAVKASSPGGPDILCLQEIESEKALRDLRDGYLENMGYRYLVFAPQGGVAATVGCLSRIEVLRTRAHDAGSFRGVPLRHILEIQLRHDGSSLYVFNNHWKSGGKPRKSWRGESGRSSTPSRRRTCWLWGILMRTWRSPSRPRGVTRRRSR